MTADRVGRHVSGGPEPEHEAKERQRKDELRAALALWATGVSILAVREAGTGGIHALTVSAFLPISVDPPLVLTSLGPNASALPYLDPGTRYAISILADDQKGTAARYADTFPVGPSPFQEEGPPRVVGSAASLVCEVDELLARGDHTLVIGKVVEASSSTGAAVLAYFRRGYRSLE